MSDDSRDLPPLSTVPGAVDCHVHLFGPHEKYELAPKRAYTPAEATLDQLKVAMDEAGISNAVIVHPSAYGKDNSLLLDALEAGEGRFRGVIGFDDDLTDGDLARMDELGVCGVRVNLVSTGAVEADAAKAILRKVAGRISKFGWHIQVFTRLTEIKVVGDLVDELPTPLIVDHMGLPIVAEGLAQPGARELISLLERAKCWVKLSGAYHVSPLSYGNAESDAFAASLAKANPERCVWGSDWPFVGKHNRRVEEKPPLLPHRNIDYTQTLALLGKWVPSEQDRTCILVDNPKKFYNF